jgi:hypothetical protein
MSTAKQDVGEMKKKGQYVDGKLPLEIEVEI